MYKIKTKITCVRPGPVQQQQEHITEKLLYCKSTCVIKKWLGAKKTSKKWWPVTFGTVAVLIARKNTGACYISALSCHTASCRHLQCWKQDQKYKTKTSTEAGLRPVLS